MNRSTKNKIYFVLAKAVKPVVIVLIILIVGAAVFKVGKSAKSFLDEGRRENIERRAEKERLYLAPGTYVKTKTIEGTIIKQYFWATDEYQIRLKDGTLTKIIRSEVIEKEEIENREL